MFMTTTHQRIESILKSLPRRFMVTYAVAVTEDCFLAIGHSNVPETAKYTLSLTKQWLKDSSSVTEQQLRDASDIGAASSFALAAAYADASSYAAATYSSSYAAAWTATTAYTADASYDAANAAAHAAYAPHRSPNYYLKMLYTMADKLPKLYKVMYGIEKLK